jgi:hypothetical protein
LLPFAIQSEPESLSLRLVVVPKNGLANRMRAIEAGATFCRRHGFEYHVEWWKEPDCNSDFAQLFEMPVSFVLRQREFPGGRAARARRHLAKAGYRLRGYPWIEDEDVLWWDHQAGRDNLRPCRRIVADGRRLPQRCRGVVLHTHRMFEPPAAAWGALRPAPALLTQARAVLERGGSAGDGRGWIGVHIRRTDHVNAQQHSPTQAFIEAIDRHLAARPGAMLFLATDSPAEESALQQRYGARLVTAAKQHWQRSTSGGVRAAMIDLLCLSLCDVILGSYWSSFSAVAAQLHGAAHDVVRAAD